MKVKQNDYDVGVIVGRFHVPELHPGHKQLFEHVAETHDNRVLIFLGNAPTKSTVINPLNYQARRQMIVEDFPNLGDNIHYINDERDDESWSKRLDGMIRDLIGPQTTVVLYGSRESFIDHYKGAFPCQEMEQEMFVSGTEMRKEASRDVISSKDWRKGVIYGIHNQYPAVYSTVDIAIFRDEKIVLLGKKPKEKQYRFIGGFVDGNNGNLQDNARREVAEETGLEIGDLEFVDSFLVDDWRYRRERCKILTTFFRADRIFGTPDPSDDIEAVKWFDIDEINDGDVVKEHHPLLKSLRANCARSQLTKRTDMPMVGVGVILHRDGKFLLGKRKGSHGEGLYSFPGGHIEKDEEITAAAINEVREETGIIIDTDAVEIFTARDEMFPEDNLHYVTVFTIVECPKDQEVENLEPDKCEGWEWYAYKDIPENLMPATRDILEKVVRKYEITQEQKVVSIHKVSPLWGLP
jgi:ADP-ribose pyrophosphatase YjhB (NUDIX family)/nicotinamide mononucleotide adenylyltransferase